MAESVDALVSNTSGAIRAGSTPAQGTIAVDNLVINRYSIFILLPFCFTLSNYFCFIELGSKSGCYRGMNGLIVGLLLPFLGTALGAACVFLMRNNMPVLLQKTLTGFAAGVMVAASVWSLLIPSIEMTGREGFMSVFPAIIGFAAGILFLLFLDMVVPHQHLEDGESEGPKSHLSRTAKLTFAVTLHNIPEGMAVGAVLAAALENNAYVPMAGALALSLGIAIQNFPEGAIVSMPLRMAGNSKKKSFLIGGLSGIVEPAAAVITILLAGIIIPVLPYLLAFASGAMMYVVVEELVPETQEGKHSNMGTIGFAAGFLLMMILDVLLG